VLDKNPIWSKSIAAPDYTEREFPFTTADFERVRKLIYGHAGISLSPAKQDMVYSRLARRLRETRLKSFGEYLDRLERGDKLEWEKFVNSLTTNLTSFPRAASFSYSCRAFEEIAGAFADQNLVLGSLNR